MFINPINQPSDNTFKAGLKPEVAKNQMRIFLTQDIWAPKLAVKMPENALEKEVTLEILKNRLKLDKFVRLKNEYFSTKASIILYNDLLEKAPNSKECEDLKAQIAKKGNLVSYFATLGKQINQEEKRNTEALKYFKDIEKVEAEYLNRKLVKSSKMSTIYYQILKNNINKDGKYSTKELIEIVEKGDNSTDLVKAKPVVEKIRSKEELRSAVRTMFVQLIREHVNIYSQAPELCLTAETIEEMVNQRFKNSIDKYPKMRKVLDEIYTSVRHSFVMDSNKIASSGTKLYPIGKIWEDMVKAEKSMKTLVSEIRELKSQLDIEPDNVELKETLNAKEHLLSEYKKDWLTGLKYSVEYELYNRQTLVDANLGAEYDRLAGQNRVILKHKAFLSEYQMNDETITDELLEKIIA